MNIYRENSFKKEWVHEPITNGIVEWCKSFGEYLSKGMTTSQLRKFFGEVKRIEMQEDINLSDVAMLNPLLAYAVGRDKNNRAMQSFQKEMSKAISEINNKKDFQNFVKIFEAIVAYHKLYGGK
ncbi:MAG: type III-A CRISPR-associated protein Csm2 [Bacteroidales bacterium]|nr:type III-A CRISPR-associated protein Csm2 [Bacteroidales bacterium]